MSRRSRSRRIPAAGGESASSKAYAQGRTVRYRSRIYGPTFPVKFISLADLDETSVFFLERLEEDS